MSTGRRIVWTLARKELRDARRNRWLVLYAAAFAVLALALSWLGLSALPGYGVAGFARTTASLVNLVLLIVPLMGLTLGAHGIAAERESGTLLHLASQPVGLSEIFLGKLFGLALGVLAALALGFGVAALPIAWAGGATEAGGYALLVALSALLGVASVALGLVVSAVARGASVALGAALFLWLALVFLGDLGLLGTAIALELTPGGLLAASLANPLQAFKLAAILATRGSLEVLGPAGTYAIDQYGASLLPILIAILAAWTLVSAWIAACLFRARGPL